MDTHLTQLKNILSERLHLPHTDTQSWNKKMVQIYKKRNLKVKTLPWKITPRGFPSILEVILIRSTISEAIESPTYEGTIS